MRATLLLAVLACSCEAWRVPAASAHATARRSQRTPMGPTPRRSALRMADDGADPDEARIRELEGGSKVRLVLAHHATRHAMRQAPRHTTVPQYHALRTTPRATHHATRHAPRHAPRHQAPKGGQGGMPTDFLGFLDVNTTFGSIAASLIVAGGFCVLVELVKFVDKSPSTPSVFGSLWG